MTRAGNIRDNSPIAQQRTQAEPLSPRSRTSLLVGIATLIASLGFLTLAITGSVIGWERWGQATLVPDVAKSEVDLTRVYARMAELAEDNRLIRTELDALTGPGGVLSRVVEQLQTFQQRDRAQAVAIDQLMRLQVQNQDPSAAAPFGQPNEADRSGPIQVTPIRTNKEELPVRVVVTPDPTTDPNIEGQGQ